MQTKAYRLLGILQEYAPDQDAQVICTTIFHRMRADGLTERDLEKQLVTALSDGLHHGNWPWIVQAGWVPNQADPGWVAVPSMIDDDQPIYEGLASKAWEVLEMGMYPAVNNKGEALLLAVQQDKSWAAKN